MNKKPIKIFRVQSRIVVGGPVLHTTLLSKKLKDEGFETILVGGAHNKHEKSMVEIARKQKINCIVIPEMGREIHFYDDLISLTKLYLLIKKENPIIFHSHTAKAGAIGRIAAFLAGVPYIYHTFHGHVFEGYFGKIKTKLFIWIERLLAKISTAVIVISKKQKYAIVQKYKIAPAQKVHEIPLGFDWDKFFTNNTESLKKKFNIPSNKFLVGIIGRIVSIKNHELFVEIAEQLNREEKDRFHFLVIGDGELREGITTLIRNKNVDRIFTFTGWINVNASVYQELDLLLLTSNNEGTPVTIIEALASGTPVIARDVGGVSDIMEKYDKRYLVKSSCPAAYTKLILELTKDNKSIPDNVRKQIISYYSQDRLVKDIKQLYEKMIRVQ